jgi:hypothetical protein
MDGRFMRIDAGNGRGRSGCKCECGLALVIEVGWMSEFGLDVWPFYGGLLGRRGRDLGRWGVCSAESSRLAVLSCKYTLSEVYACALVWSFQGLLVVRRVPE